MVRFLEDSGESKIELRSLEAVEDELLMVAITPVMRSSVCALSDHSIEAKTRLQQKCLEDLRISVSTAETKAEQLVRSAQSVVEWRNRPLAALPEREDLTLRAINFQAVRKCLADILGLE